MCWFARVFEQETMCFCTFAPRIRSELRANGAARARGSMGSHRQHAVTHQLSWSPRNTCEIDRFHCVTAKTSSPSRSSEFVRAVCRTIEAGCGGSTARAVHIQPTSNAQFNLSLCGNPSMTMVSVTLTIGCVWRVRCERLFGGPNRARY